MIPLDKRCLPPFYNYLPADFCDTTNTAPVPPDICHTVEFFKNSDTHRLQPASGGTKAEWSAYMAVDAHKLRVAALCLCHDNRLPSLAMLPAGTLDEMREPGPCLYAWMLLRRQLLAVPQQQQVVLLPATTTTTPPITVLLFTRAGIRTLDLVLFASKRTVRTLLC